MRRTAVRLLTVLVRWICAPDHHRFMAGFDDVAGAQMRLRHRLAKHTAQTAYGRRFPEPPLATWEDLEPWLKRQTGGEPRVIAYDKFIHTEPTSGSSGTVKAVPYTCSMKSAFARMFRIWAFDLLRDLPLLSGRIFISQSPRGDVRRETQYLGGVLEAILSPFLVRLSHDRPFLDDVAQTLLAQRDLEVISVWSPSYLSVVLDHIDATGLGDWRSAWPNLRLISCWDQGQAAAIADVLRTHFPGVKLQGKGLLSTEAPMTVPIDGIGCLPLYQDILFEFLPQDAEGGAKGTTLALDQLEAGRVYEAVITTPAGLVRYRTDDLVRVSGHYRTAPILVFVGRKSHVSDLVGEKLSEPFVREAMTPLIPDGRFVLVPDTDRYVLFTERAIDAGLADQALCAAHHYRLARDQGQLRSVDICILPGLLEARRAFAVAQGQDFGHIKDSALISDPRQARAFMEFADRP